MNDQIKNFTNRLKTTWPVIFTVTVLILSCVTFQSATAASNDTNVSVIKRALPVYPKFAVNNKIEGTVLVSFSIEKDGNVSDIQVEASDHDGLFDASAILGIQRWVYTQPAKKIRNNYVAIEFVLTDKADVSYFSNVERIKVTGK